MQILFVTHPYPNYVPDLLLHGLRKLIGPDVVDYPRKDCLYEGVLGLGVCPPDQRCPGWFPDDAGMGIDRDDIWTKLNRGYFDLVVCDFRAYPEFKKSVNGMHIRLVLIDGEDRPVHIPPGPYIVCRRETDGTDYSIPLPMALPEEVLLWITRFDNEEKRYSIGFLGSTAGDNRRHITEVLSTNYQNVLLTATEVPSDTNQTPKGRRSRDDYYRQLQQCRIVLSLPGTGLDTFRFWENSACNAVHLVPQMPLLIPNAFVPDHHVKRYSHREDVFRRQIDSILNGSPSVREMIFLNRQHLVRHHLTTSRGDYFLRKALLAFNIQAQ